MATRFFCENPDCDRYQELTIAGKLTYRYNGNEFVPENQYCPNCGKLMAYLETKEEGPITCNYAGFSSMDSDQKKAILKKRTQMFDKKNDAQGVKEHNRNKVLKKFFNK